VKTVPFGITAFDLKLNFYSHQFTIFMKDITYTWLPLLFHLYFWNEPEFFKFFFKLTNKLEKRQIEIYEIVKISRRLK